MSDYDNLIYEAADKSFTPNIKRARNIIDRTIRKAMKDAWCLVSYEGNRIAFLIDDPLNDPRYDIDLYKVIHNEIVDGQDGIPAEPLTLLGLKALFEKLLKEVDETIAMTKEKYPNWWEDLEEYNELTELHNLPE